MRDSSMVQKLMHRLLNFNDRIKTNKRSNDLLKKTYFIGHIW